MDEGGSDFFIGGDDLLRNQQFRGQGGPRPWRGDGPGPGMMRGRPPFDHFNRGFDYHGGPPMGMGNPGRFRGPPPRGPPGFMGRGGMMMRGSPGPQFRPHRPPPRFRPPDQAMEDEEQIWAETVSPNDGKVYFYNVKTRVTDWTKPEGPNVRIVTHEEWMQMVTGGRNSNDRDDEGPDADGPGRRNPFQQDEMLDDGFQEDGDEMESSRDMQRDGFGSSAGQKEDLGTDTTSAGQPRPPGLMDQELSPPHTLKPPLGLQAQFPPPTAHQLGQNAASAGAFSHDPPKLGASGFNSTPEKPVPSQQGPIMTPSVAGQAPPFAPFMGMPPPLGMPPPGVPGPFPNFTMMPPPWTPMTPAGVPPPMLQQIDPAVLAAAFEWSEHTAPDGRMYYYHTKTQKSVWDKPQALIDLDQAKSTLMLAAMQAQRMQQAVQLNQVGRNPANDLNDFSKKDAAKKAEKKTAEKCRPVSSTPVPGTPWCVVWTGDRRVFFYNPLNKQSVWDRPADLVGRVDVDEMVRSCPADKPEKKVKAEASSTTSPSQKTVKEQNGNSDSDGGTAEEGTKPPPKKKRKKNSTVPHEVTDELKQDGAGDQSDSSDKIMIETKDGPKEVSPIEVEQKAAKERAIIPLETRLKQFHEMLVEKQVSAFSTWEKELHKIVYDCRYLLLTSKERKQSFDNFVKERAEEEKHEMKQKHKENRANFVKFLKEINVTPKMSYNEFTQKYGREEQYKLIEKPRDRESYFADYIHELKQKDKKEAAARREQDREEFNKLLKEKITDYHIKWPEAKKKIENDPRYSGLDSDERESLYKSFCRSLKSEMKTKEKKEKKERKEQKKRERQQQGDPEVIDLEKESPDNAKGEGDGDGSEEEEGCISDESDDEARADKERKERAEFSIREREKEVQKSLASHLRDRDKERDYYLHEEATQQFQALLTDLVRNTDVGWKEMKSTLKEDRRWESVSILARDEMEDLYNAHLDAIGKKKRQRFRELLDEANIQLDTEWKDIRKVIKDDPRYLKFSSNERKCEREFEMYLKDIHARMKNEFRELLKETKSLTYKTRSQITTTGATIREIDAVLSKDKRWHQMDRFVHVREKMLMDYIDELERKGPPPPPTSTRADLPPPSSSHSLSASRKFK